MRPASLEGNIGIYFGEDGDKSHPSIGADDLTLSYSPVIEIIKKSPPLSPAFRLCQSEVYDLLLFPLYRIPSATRTGRLTEPVPVFLLIMIPSRTIALKPCCDTSSVECPYCVIEGFCNSAYRLGTYFLSQNGCKGNADLSCREA